MPGEDPLTLAELESFVLNRAAHDAHFRHALLLDPREAISAELGIELPAGIEAVEVAPGRIALTLPPGLAAVEPSLRASPAAQLRDDCCCCC